METDVSGWTALVNAGNLAKGTGGTDGSANLLWKATAAGDCQVGLVTRVAVTPGSTYLSFASIWGPVNGAQSRLEIRWYNSGGTLLSTVQGPLVTVATPQWAQNAASGVAPATAATALVVLRATATAAAQTWFADRVFLGLMPSPATGNLFDFLTQSVEVDGSAWTAPVNASMSLMLNGVEWFQALRATSVAAGDVQVYNANRPAVAAGTEYIGYAMVQPSTSGLTQKVELWWYDSGGTKLSESSATWIPATGAWTRCAVIATAPAGAASARLVLRPTATAASQQWAYDKMVLAPTSALGQAGNILGYNAADIEQDASGWTVTGGVGSQSTAVVYNGAYALKMVADGTGDMEVSLTVPVPVTPKMGYRFTPGLIRPAGAANYTTRIDWLDASGTVVRTRSQDWGGSTGFWLYGPMGDLAPSNAATMRVAVVFESLSAGDTWYMDNVYAGLGGLTVLAVPAGGGGVSLTVRGLTTGGPSWKWTLSRLGADGSATPVRGWTADLVEQATTGDVAVVTDYEAPLGIPVAWRVRSHDPAGSASISYTTDPLTLTGEVTDAWLTDVQLPARSVAATVGVPLPDWQRSARQGAYSVKGRPRPVVISDVRSSRTGTLSLVTETEEERDALWWVLETGNTLLIKWPVNFTEPDMYVQVADVTEAHITANAEHSDRTWTLALTEVDRPIGGIIGSPDRTWQTVKDAGPDWSTAVGGATTWLDVFTGVVGS
ncbi:hypothetical protein [Streptomyces asiaticus]|uniref:hypothetical protein n=1 Tax=Streptomyces asiaticus TaxID=114695 RepID=UPI001BAD36F1|nr:hypothetical protein [Streptomyces asiaticus]